MDIYLHCGVLCMKMYIFDKKKKGGVLCRIILLKI